MCLNCGQVLCGRYENGHALHHSELNTQHNVCLNTLNCMVYCYKCDDFVINGKHLLDNLRKEFNSDDLYSSSESNPASASSSDSGCSDETMLNVTSPITGRRLRPRKRTNSNPNENGNVSPMKKKFMRKVSTQKREHFLYYSLSEWRESHEYTGNKFFFCFSFYFINGEKSGDWSTKFR